jgi:hypothetical protein
MRRWGDRAERYGSRCTPAVLAAALAAGCGGGVTPTRWSSDQTWSSAHFVFHAKPDDSSVDATAVDALEAHAAVTALRWLGLSPDAWGPIDYFKYHDENELVAAGSPCNDRPCTTLFESGRIEIHTPLAIDEHELTHGYVLGSSCAPPLFREGLAVSASCDPANEPLYRTSADHPPWLTLSWRDLGDFTGPAPAAYQPAGALVTWIVDQWGVASFMSFYRSLRCNMSNDQIAAAFDAHYGQSLDGVWNAMTAAPRRRLCAFTWGCSESPMFGAVPLTNALAGHRTAVPIPATGAIVRATYVPTANPPALRGCTADAALPGFDGHWPLEPDAWFPVALLPATGGNVAALADVRGAGDNPLVELDTTVTPLAASSVVADGACATATPLVLEEPRGTVLVWPHPGGSAVFQVQSSSVPAQATTQIGYDFSGPDLANVQVCSTCAGGDLQDCADAIAAPRMNAPWLRVDWSPVIPSLLTLSFEWE